jgi:Peptidase MA superfamily
VLTHELSHLALHRAVHGASLPRWFAEGVAVQQAQDSSLGRIRTLWEGTLRGDLLSLDALANAFPESHSDVDLAYAESADFVGFMLSSGDERSRFRSLLRDLANGQPFADAVLASYHVPVAYMEREWRATLTQRFGRWPVLFMGLTSLWVLGAVLLVVGYARARARHRSTLQRWAIEEAPVVVTAVTASAAPAPTGAVQSSLDDFFDNRRGKHDAGVPTIVHDGRSHTLH